MSDEGRVRSWARPPGPYLRRLHTNRYGYPVLGLAGAEGKRTRAVHVLLMAAFVGPCPPGHEVRHLDGNRANSRLDNLAYGTRKENAADCLAHGNHASVRKTHCPRNHPYDEANTYLTPTGKRDCRTCRTEASRRSKEGRAA